MVNHLAWAPQGQNQQDNILDGPVAVLWDIECCPVPYGVQPENVAGNVQKALRTHPVIKGAITLFSAYGDFSVFSRRIREGCQRTGVKLVDVPSGRKFATDKAILVDMFLFALDNRPPASILLISGDADFSSALHILGQRGYSVAVIVPAIADVESALSSAGRFVWDWPTVARGEGFVPRSVVPHACEPAGYHISCQLGCQKNGQNEEMLVRREIPKSEYSIPAEKEPVFLHKYARIPMEFEGTHFSSKCKTPQGLQSNPTKASKFSEIRWGEQSLQVQSLDTDKKHTNKLKMKQKEYSAPAKINTIFRYKYDPVFKELNGNPQSSAEYNGSNTVFSNPNSSEVPLVGQNGSWELGKEMKKQSEFGTLAKIDPTCHYRHPPISKEFSGIPHLLSEYNNPQSPSEPSEVLLVENGLTQAKLQVQSTNVDGRQAKKRMRKRKKFSGISQSLSEYNNPQSLLSEPSEILPVENGLTQVKLQVQPPIVDGRQPKERRGMKIMKQSEHDEPTSQTMKQNEYDEPPTPVFSFKYCQVPVESNKTHKTHNTSDYNSLQSLPTNLSEVSLVHQDASQGHKLQEHSLNINEDQARKDEDEMK